MKRAKAAVGLTGVRGVRSDAGGMIDFRPYGSATVLFINDADEDAGRDGTLADLKGEYRMFGDDGDPWGAVMGVWFQVAHHLEARGRLAPAAWSFNPGALGPHVDRDDVWFEALDGASDAALIAFGNILCRYAAKLKVAGKDY